MPSEVLYPVSIRRTRQRAARSDRIHAVYHGIPLPGPDESGHYERVGQMLATSVPQVYSRTRFVKSTRHWFHPPGRQIDLSMALPAHERTEKAAFSYGSCPEYGRPAQPPGVAMIEMSPVHGLPPQAELVVGEV